MSSEKHFLARREAILKQHVTCAKQMNEYWEERENEMII